MSQIAETVDPSSPKRRWLLWTSVGLVAIAGAGAAYVYWRADVLVERHLRPATIALLEDRFDSRVELNSLRVRFVPTLTVRGEG